MPRRVEGSRPGEGGHSLEAKRNFLFSCLSGNKQGWTWGSKLRTHLFFFREGHKSQWQQGLLLYDRQKFFIQKVWRDLFDQTHDHEINALPAILKKPKQENIVWFICCWFQRYGLKAYSVTINILTGSNIKKPSHSPRPPFRLPLSDLIYSCCCC